MDPIYTQLVLSAFLGRPLMNNVFTQSHGPYKPDTHRRSCCIDDDRNATYTHLFGQHSELLARYDELSKAYTLLAIAVPQVFQIIPNSFGLDITLPSTSSSISTSSRVPLSKSDYPRVTNWDRKDYKADSDLTQISDDDEDTVSKLGFLEHKDGTKFAKDEIIALRKHVRAAFQTLLDKKIAPASWSQASSVATNWFRSEMLTFCAALGLCSDYWKIDSLATEVHPQWSRTRKAAIAAQTKAEKRKLSDDDDEKNDRKRQKKKEKTSSMPTDASRSRRKKAKETTNDIDIEPASPIPAPAPVPPSAPAPPLPVPATATSSTPRAPAISPAPATAPAPVPPSPAPATATSSTPCAPVISPAPASAPASVPTPVPASPTPSHPVVTSASPHSTLPVGVQSAVLESIANPLTRQDPTQSRPTPRISNPLAQLFEAKDRAGWRPLNQTPAVISESSASSSTVAAPAATPTPGPSKPTGKPKPHKPGKADTAWNLFGREHMAHNRNDTQEQVKLAYDGLDADSRKRYNIASAQLKKGKGKETESDAV
ncbi:hypothetical protein C8R44DRAFT_891931 [Mycena epipterygia]|nr:hypothetical protein C8R44DRAFT_891931 [Mycena epipterygia]